MGIQSKTIKNRRCDKCSKEIKTDAVGIKKHAKECKGK